MCEECYMTFCPEDCPSYDGEGSAPIGRCERCGEYIYPDEECVSAEEKLYCETCVERLDTDTILYICGFTAVIELLHELGVEAAGRGGE